MLEHKGSVDNQNVEDTKAYVGYMASKNEISDYNWIVELDNKIIGSISVCYSDDYLVF